MNDFYKVTFSNGGLQKLEELSDYFGVSKEEVLKKGMQLLDVSRENSLCKQDKDGKIYTIDIKKL